MCNGKSRCLDMCAVSCVLQTGNVVGVQRSREGAMHVFVNGCDLGPAVFGVPEVLCIQSGGVYFMRRK